MEKISKDNRFVATIENINYGSFNSEGVTVCNITAVMRFRSKVIDKLHIVTIARSVESTQDYDVEYGKTLARAKAEMKMYESIKEKITNAILNNATTKDFNNDKAIKDAIIMMNTIQFCNKMIKHQITYINKLIRNKFPNE